MRCSTARCGRSARRAPRSSAPTPGSRSTALSTSRSSFTLIPREGEPQRIFDPPAEGGLRHEADEVARCIEAGELESPEMPLDETVAIMRTMDAVIASDR